MQGAPLNGMPADIGSRSAKVRAALDDDHPGQGLSRPQPSRLANPPGFVAQKSGPENEPSGVSFSDKWRDFFGAIGGAPARPGGGEPAGGAPRKKQPKQ